MKAHLISHTHWDREWYLNSKYTNEWLVPFFDALLRMLEKEPHYRFVLDGQTSMIEDCCEQLERQGQDVASFKQRLQKYASEGRLLVGPYYLQPDWQLVSDEALVRTLLIGEQTAREFGPVMRVGWLLDNFGQISQAPQIHREFGIEGLYLWRGVEMAPTEIQSEFLWKSPDGTTSTAVYLVGSYRNGMRLAEYRESMQDRIKVQVAKLAPFATSPNILIMNGYDQEMVPDDIMPLIERGAMDWDGVQIVQSTPEEYIEAIERHHPNLQVFEGALYSGRYISVFPGILSSRMYLKIENDLCQRQLERYAEPLATVAWGLGFPYPTNELTRCWKLLLKNHPHDSICGVSIDDVHTDMEMLFKEAHTLAQDITHSALSSWLTKIHTTRYDDAASRWVIVNTSPRERSGVIALETELSAVKDSEGNILPVQKSERGRTLVFLPKIPGLGYRTIYATDSASASPRIDSPVTCDPAEGTLENENIHVKVHTDGSLTLTDKINRATYPHLAIFQDEADAGDEYNYSPPPHDQVITTENRQAQIEWLETGPLRAKLKISIALPLPEELTPDRNCRSARLRLLPIVTWLTLDMHSPMIKFHTQVRNTVKDHRLRVLFPTGIRTDHSHAETQFDVTRHKIEPAAYDDSTIPAEVKQILLGAREPEPTTIFPQRTFVDLNDGKRGIAILNHGLPEYEVLKDNNTVALTLFRSIGWIARSDLRSRIGDAGPLIAVPDAQCLRTMEFDYAILPHAGDWQAGRVSELADEFNSDLLAVQAERYAGSLADSGGFLSLEDNGQLLKLTAIKRSEDGQAVIVRFHNPTDVTVEGRIKTLFRIHRASYVTLGENEKEAIKIEDDHIVLVLAAAKKIVTIRLEIERKPEMEWRLQPVTLNLHQRNRLKPPLQNGRLFEGDGDEVDSSTYEPMAAITLADVESEEKRAAELERNLIEKERALSENPTVTALQLSQVRLDVETAKRAYWEARLSATLLRKKYLESSAEKPISQSELASFEGTLREIGLTLNQSRVGKRAWEYIVDCYQRQNAEFPPS